VKTKTKVYKVNDFQWDLYNITKTLKRIIQIDKLKKSNIDNQVYDKLQAIFFNFIKDSYECEDNKFENNVDIYLIANPNNNKTLLNNILRQNKDFFKVICKENWHSFKKVLFKSMSFDDIFKLIINKLNLEKSINTNSYYFQEEMVFRIHSINILMDLLIEKNITDFQYHNKVKSFLINNIRFIFNNAKDESDIDFITESIYVDRNSFCVSFLDLVYTFMDHFDCYFFDIISQMNIMCKRLSPNDESFDLDFWNDAIFKFRDRFSIYNGCRIKESKLIWFKF
jgi:hypothetical protein